MMRAIKSPLLPPAGKVGVRCTRCYASQVAEPFMLPNISVDKGRIGEVPFSMKVADAKTARHVVHRYLVMVQQNARKGTANTKTRSEVRGGGAKPYQQKGSGRARRGSDRTPLRPGGGITFGPKPKDWSIKMNKKERKLAMGTALQSAARDITIVPDFRFIEPGCKTRDLVNGCNQIGVDLMKDYTLIITCGSNAKVHRAGRNIAKLTLNMSTALQVYDVLRADKIIIEAPALKLLHKRYGGGRRVMAKSDSGISEAVAVNLPEEQAAEQTKEIISSEGSSEAVALEEPEQ